MDERYIDACVIGMQTKKDEAWEELPEYCKQCKQLTQFYSCGLQEDEDDDCPLPSISCKECVYCCDIVRKDGEKLDGYYYCELKEYPLDDDDTACREFERG